jgi:hypothetical protein
MPSPNSSARWILEAGPLATTGALLVLLACAAYRFAVVVQVVQEGTDYVAWSMNGLGFVFLIAAIYTAARFPPRYLVVVLYFLLQAVHWGGSLQGYLPAPYPLLVYLLVGSVTASTLLLHFALDMANASLPRWLVYLPSLLMLVMLAAVTWLDAAILQGVVGLCMLVAAGLYPIAATVLLVRYVWRTPIRTAVLLWLLPVIVATLAAVVPGVDLAGHGYEPFNLLYIAEIVLILVIVGYHRTTRIE